MSPQCWTRSLASTKINPDSTDPAYGTPMRKIVLLLLVAAAQLISNPVLAARTYDIELLLFAIQGDASGSQLLTDDPEGVDWENSTPLGDNRRLPSGRGRLGAKERALQRAEGFDPLIHAAWRQNIRSRESAKAWYVRSERTIAPGTPKVEGLVKLSVGRYLHVELDLLIRKKADDAVGGFRNYRVTTHRRMRSKELHYIDHPMLGMLIEITPAGG